jgi:FKBP-type peptidyl-prolyl cis-trans isomerase FkpA
MKGIKLLNLAYLILIFAAASCNKEADWERQENKQIAEFLKSKPDSTYVLKPSGLYFFELKKGTGLSPTVNDTAYFRYIGRFIDGTAFDSLSTVKAPYAYVIGSGLIVSGVDEGLKYMKEGGKAGLLTPSKLAWGARGVYGVIPSYAPLLWELELVSVKTGPHKK